jgi:hypothetical protein
MIVSITGGLGNQLFQMYAGLFFEKQEIDLSCEFGNPRSSNGLPDLFYFALPSRIGISRSKKQSRVSKKFGGFAISRNFIQLPVDRFFLSRSALTTIMNVYFSMMLKQRINHFSSPEVGFVDVTSGRHNLVFGYFQTYRYFHSLDSEDKKLTLREETEKFAQLKDMAVKSGPIVVHVRLGDYIKEKHFGILTTNFYAKAFSRLNINSSSQPIWVFSDDPRKAIKILPIEYKKRYFLVPNHGLNSAETLELMRYGSSYVIANSTFSWWGANLSYTNDPAVVAPEKWFAGMQDPRDLIPGHWMTEKR